MDEVVIKVKPLLGNTDIDLPKYESQGASGMDLRACVDEPIILNHGDIRLIPTGLSFSIPYGYEGQIRPRSGLALKHGIGLVNSPGTIDSDFRGEVKIIMINWGENAYTIHRGDRIAQMVIAKIGKAKISVVTDLDSTKRGEGGFGHSGTN